MERTKQTKRKAPEAVGVLSDNAPAPKQPRTQLGEDDAEDDDELGQELVDSTQAQRDDDSEHLEPYAVLNGRCVGVRYYNGIATIGEQVLFRREPNNAYDRNAIRINNVNGVQIGHVPRHLAARLAPLLDRRIAGLEGIVAGRKGQFDMPIRYEILCPSREPDRSAAIMVIKAARIPGAILSEEYKRMEKQMREREKAAKEAEKARRRLKTKGGAAGPRGKGAVEEPIGQDAEFMGSQTSSQEARENWENLTAGALQMINPREVSELVQKFGASEEDLQKMEMATQPARLKTQLLPYQLQGLAWLLQQEHPQLPTGDQVIQLWKLSGPGRYTNIATNFTINEPPPLASAGLLADDMGLGKTLQTIALIVADVTAEKKLVPVPKVDESTCTGGTLIVAPVSVMSNWSGQIEQHVSSDHPLQVLRYHASGKQAKLTDYDVVVTSYGTLSSDYGARKKGLFAVKWRRVVLDEAHLIRNPKSKASLAAHGLDAASRWALSGTPIVNNLKDLYSLIRFMRYSGGLAEFDIFNRTLIRPLNRGELGASQLLQILMATVCLRRLKDMKFVDLRLPEMTEFLHKVEFWPEEKEKYDVLEMEAKGLLAKYQKGKNTNGADEYRFLLEILLRMRQMCNHQTLCGDRLESLMKLAHTDKVDLTDENIRALRDLLQLAIDAQEECSICLETLHNPRITICKHIFDHECIEKTIDLQHKCPMCRCPLPDLLTSTVSPPLPTVSPSSPQGAGSSSKIEALITILLATRSKSPGTKTVVFSQWTSFLTLLEPFLAQKGITFARIDGSMKPPKRDESIARFSGPDCEVLLASLAVANVGLNLVMASQVVLADSWWAPAVEDQAIDRVYRLGQKKPVTVWRIVVEGSIEGRVLGIQEEKRRIVADAFREGKGKRGRKTREERGREVGVLLGGGD
ncbi:hypothetical protein K440DRAFT_641993 [Wilcoxina mikolae CBS 423.85]|nr:hypothetical protein K440DRAFT_641993 [Wilcoxina mikolae CBS 423.85]